MFTDQANSQASAVGSLGCASRAPETPESVGEVLKHIMELARTNRTSAHVIKETLGYRGGNGDSVKDPAGSGLLDALRELRGILGQTDVALSQARSILGV